jgi:hypothetical protein
LCIFISVLWLVMININKVCFRKNLKLISHILERTEGLKKVFSLFISPTKFFTRFTFLLHIKCYHNLVQI